MTQLRHIFFLFTLPVAILETLVCITIAQAQITPDSSLGAESSVVNPDVINGIPSDRIDGGATRGSSLFHSFQEFNVGAGRGAYFSNPANITNILTRVTGGNPSNILGRLGVLGNANLFLLNPKGIFFGRNASLDLNGSFFGTTADSFIFNNNFEFSATNPQAVPLLSVNIPIGLRFRDNPGSIQVQGDGQGLRSYTDEIINTTSGLRVQPNQTLALVGGDVFLEGATLKTAGGRIELGSVGGSGLVSITPINKGFALGYGNVQNFGNIQLSQQTSVDASGLGGGDIQVWGRRITLANGSQIEASTLGSQQGGLLSVNATEQVEVVGTSSDGGFLTGFFTQVYPGATGAAGDLIVNTSQLFVRDGAQINANTLGAGKGGNLTITGDKVQLIGISTTANGEYPSGLRTATEPGATGAAGDLTIKTGELLVRDGAQINASTFGAGKGGNLTITADKVQVIGRSTNGQFYSALGTIVGSEASEAAGNLTINTGELIVQDGGVINVSTYGRGNAGIIKINATRNISVDGNDSFIASGVAFSSVGGNAGGIEINTNNFSLTNGAEILADTYGQGNGGIVKINATGNITADGFGTKISSAVNSSAVGNSGGIEINTNNLFLTDGAEITANTNGRGNAGIVKINATGNITADGGSEISSAINSSGVGSSGGIEINTNNLSLTDDAEISASTFGGGNAGIVKINATGEISADGGSEISSIAGFFVEGNSGGIEINTKNLFLTNGGQINANTRGDANAGRIIINATGNISVSGETKNGSSSGIFSQVTQTAQGNSDGIQISTKNLFLSDGGRINASTFGNGNAGSIIINATNLVSIDGESDIFSRAESRRYEGNAGGIQINTKDLSLTNGGQISGSTFGNGNAGRVVINATGDISIDGEDKQGFLSGIFSQVGLRAEGNSGGIEINTNNLSVTNGGIIDASTSGEGDAGRVIINATGNISVEGETKNGRNSGIFSRVFQNSEGSSSGILINTKDLSLTNGGRIDASTFGKGNAGSVIINATGNVSASGETKNGQFVSGIYSVANPSGVGNAGGIQINARSLSLSNRAILSANSEGTGAAGDIKVTTVKDIRLDNRASITATTKGDQGNIFLNSRDLILRRNSNITTNATGTARGGNIRIVTGNFVALENSDITANAQKGFGGNIFIKAAYRFASPDSDITAASDLGTQFSGTVQVNNTDVDPSQGLMQLPDNPTDASNQIAENPCQKGFGSSFIITGRGGLPSSPNDSFATDNVRVDLAQPAINSSSQAVTSNQPKASATTKQIVPARGWIFNEKGEVVLTAYDVNSAEFQRQYLRQNSAGCRAF
ncbi:hypothetical protein B4U84_08395 [Westiellopsis prolifica IICB1]|nr:hypothetical protein B4U84_08395 [Westiellopsis prolifica IICB1]